MLWHIKKEFKIIVTVSCNDAVPTKTALVAYSKSKSKPRGETCVDIIVSPLDHMDADLGRVLVGHELGHIISGHEKEMLYIIKNKLGDTADPNYTKWRELLEEEADEIGLQIVYAFGKPLERKTIDEATFKKNIGTLPIVDGRTPKANIREEREAIFNSLYDNFYVHNPVNLLCHVLSNMVKNGKMKTKTSSEIIKLSENIHSSYRNFLVNRPKTVLRQHEPCVSCKHSHYDAFKCPKNVP